MDRERDEQGCFTEQLTDKRVLDALEEENEEHTVKSAQQIADQLGFTRQAVDQKLRDLQSSNKVEKLTLGQRNVAWRRSNNDSESLATFIPNKD